MPSQVRSVDYQITGVTSLDDLVEMMRYDGMRFPSTDNGGTWRQQLKALCRRDAGIVDPDMPTEGYSITLVKDQVRSWIPTFGRWQSFGMEIDSDKNWTPLTRWNSARLIN